MTQYLLQVELATKRLIKNYEISEECPARTVVPEGREQVIITDKTKFDLAVSVEKDHRINTHAQRILDFTKEERELTSPAIMINTVAGESSISKQPVKAGYLYKWTESGWEEIAPVVGEKRFIYTLNAIYAYDGTKWSEDPGPLPKLEYEIKEGDIDWTIV